MGSADVLVTGGTGFVGVYVVRDLLAAGRRVAVFDLRPDLDLLDLITGESARERVEVIRGDATAGGEIDAAVERTGARVMVHLASAVPPESERHPCASLVGMTAAQINVLEAARRFEMRRVVFASAPSVFGSPRHHGGADRPIANDAPHVPETLYGIGKSANERVAELYWSRYRVDSIGLRLCQGYGPGKKRGRPYGYLMFDAAVNGEPCRVPYGDDDINWQYVEDMSRLIVLGCDVQTPVHRCFSTSGEVLAMREAVDILAGLAPEARFELEPGVADFPWRYDTGVLEAEIGVGTCTSVRDGFRRTVDTMRAWRDAGRW